jgi:hypothetical protein
MISGGGSGSTRILRCTNKQCEYQTPIMGGALNLISQCPVCSSEMKLHEPGDPPV